MGTIGLVSGGGGRGVHRRDHDRVRDLGAMIHRRNMESVRDLGGNDPPTQHGKRQGLGGVRVHRRDLDCV